jgi:hypothetical protein
MASNSPAAKLSAGALTVNIWMNTIQKNGKDIQLPTVTTQRSYKDRNGDWQNSHSLRVDDLPKAILLLSRAYEQLILKSVTNDGAGFSQADEAIV